MKVVRHEEFNAGCEATCNGPYARPWSKTMIGPGPELTHFVFELTYNYGVKSYNHGDDLRHIAIAKDLALERAKKENYPITNTKEGSVVLDADGYCWSLADSNRSATNPVLWVSLNVADLERTKDFYTTIAEMKVFESGQSENGDKFIRVGYSEAQTLLELVERKDKKGVAIEHYTAFGRIAIACKDVHPIHERVKKAGVKILHSPTKLDTAGKATVEVVIVCDRDGNEICFVEETGFNALSTPKEGADSIDWNYRAEWGADK